MNGGMPTQVGVIIPVYNRRKILLETLPYVIGQTLPPARLVIADDGSDDGTPDAAEQWLQQKGRGIDWVVRRIPHGGPSAARNAGFESVADLPLITFLDSDDHWPADFLLRASRALEQRPDAVAVSAPRTFKAHEPQFENQHPGGTALAERPLAWLFCHGGGIASCTVLRTSAFERSSRWNEKMGSSEDTLLFCEIATLGPWLHSPGEPVTFNLGSAAKLGETGNLSLRHSRLIKWARTHERIYRSICRGRTDVDHTVLRSEIADRWYRAARQQQRKGNHRFGRTLLKRSLRWKPGHLRFWRKLVKSYFQ